MPPEPATVIPEAAEPPCGMHGPLAAASCGKAKMDPASPTVAGMTPEFHDPPPCLRPGFGPARRGLHPDRRQWTVEYADPAQRDGILVLRALHRPDRLGLFRRHADRLSGDAANHRICRPYPGVLALGAARLLPL